MSTYLKTCEMPENSGKPIFCPIDKKMNFLPFEW